MSEGERDFLTRWSRRKVESRDGGLRKKSTGEPPQPERKAGRMITDAPPPKQAEPATAEQAETGDVPVREVPTKDERTVAREASLQEEQPVARMDEAGEPAPGAPEAADPAQFEDFDFDSLNYSSDYTQFMKEGVPEAVRRRALRMLWSSNPVLANIDGLNDYDEDFTDAALAVKMLTSNYRPGSGYMSDEEIQASYSEEARKAGAPPEEDEVADAGEDESEDVGEGDDDVSEEVRTAASTEEPGEEGSPEENETG